ncbi:MAG: GTP cyclohydrolase I FolE [Burkholderiales bacterium]|nr:GTP cyclohydrolase I FolE [Burkholderiales bacterium]
MAVNELGYRIHKLLLAKNLENPIVAEKIAQWVENKPELENKLASFLQQLGFDLNNDSLSNTPYRVVEFLMNELFYGLDYQKFPHISTTLNEYEYTSPIFSKHITVDSTCEHHLVAIRGYATIAYIPQTKIIGLSKLNRIVDFFAKRPQLQERLTRQILVAVQEILATENVAILINAVHDCIVRRGIKNHASEILTVETGGVFTTDLGLKANFYYHTNNK